MKKMSKYDEFIQPFLDGELSREELDWFNKELESNAVLAEDIKLYREVDSAIREQDVMDLRYQLNLIHNSIGDTTQESDQHSRIRKMLSYGAIASLAILISFGIVLKVQHKKLTNEQIYQRHYEPYEVTMVYRSGETQNLITLAQMRYDAQDYYGAIEIYEQILGRDPGNMESNLYSGISYLETEQYSKAENKFGTIIDHNDNLYLEQAEWYLGFCYLQTGRNLEARAHFKEISKGEGSFNKKARKIMRSIQ
jgi:tetratricopeptide (TPR) repeat protein